MALSNLTKVQTVGIGSNIEVVGVITTGQFKSGTSNLHSTGVELTNLNVSGIATIGGNLSIGGTLTYQDVTNIDSVGVITAREGIKIPDNKFIKIGSSDDLQIYHAAGAGSHINNTGLLNIDGTTGVRLEYNNATRVDCTTSGVSLVGDVDVADKIIHTGDTNTAIRFPTADTISLETAGSERLRIDSNGYVGIKESSPHLYYSPDLVVKAGAENGGITIRSAGTTDNNYLMFADGNSGDTRYDGYIKYNHSNRFFDFATATNVRLRITSTGLVGINETSPGTHLHVNSAGYDGVATFESTDANAHILIKDNNTHATGTYFGVEGNDFRWITHNDSSSAERLRLTKNGNIQHRDGTGISYFNGASEYIFNSTTSSPPAGGFEAEVQIQSYKTRAHLGINAYMNNPGGPLISFLSSRSGTIGTLGTKVQSNDYLGEMRFSGDNGTNYNSVAHGATIWARAKSTPGDGDSVIAGELHFATGTANAGSVTDNMVIQKDGQLDLKRGRVNDNGHMVYRGGGRIAGTATVSLDIPVLNDGNIYWIEAFYTHHSLSYGGYLYGVYGAYSGHNGLQINNTIGSSTAGGGNAGTWSVSRGSAGTPVVVAKSAGSYGGMGYYWIHVHAGNVSNL